MEDVGDFEEFEDIDGFDEYEEFIDSLRKEEESFNKPVIRDVANIDMSEKHKEYIRDKRILDEMSDEIDAYSSKIYPEKKGYRSLILEYFSTDVCIELEKIRRNFSIDSNRKMNEIIKILKKYNIPFNQLGGGTNRYGVMIDGYCVKIAYDIDGMTDNKREFLYSIALQPYVIKTYECSPTGLLSVCEYVMGLTEAEFTNRDIQEKMRKILKEISGSFFIGDVGITSKNYGNWGIRLDTDELVILDFAYVYSVSYNTFQCTCSGKGMLYYDKDFVNLICPLCGNKYTFGQIRKRISKKQQAAEIGNIEEKGYLLNKPYQEKKFNHRFMIGATDTIRKKIEKDKEKARLKDEWKEGKKVTESSYSDYLPYEEVLELLHLNK